MAAMLGSSGMANCDHEVRAEEDVDLAEFDDLVVIDVPCRPEDDKCHLTVLLNLRSLVRRDGVFDSEWVQ
jgi:hypothetical protein